MDAFVEEVLNLAKTTQAKHPLIKRLSSGCNNTATISNGPVELTATPATPKLSPVETSINHVTSETAEPTFAYITPGMYDYGQRSGFSSALNLSNMIRSSVECHHPNYDASRPTEWGEYSASNAYNGAMIEDTVYNTTTYLSTYHPQVGPRAPQEFPVTYAPQFYDSSNLPDMNGYQNIQQVSGKVSENELSNLPVSVDASNAENGIGVTCPRRLSVIT